MAVSRALNLNYHFFAKMKQKHTDILENVFIRHHKSGHFNAFDFYIIIIICNEILYICLNSI